MSTNQKNDWQISYQAALLELDPIRLYERIEQACKAIQVQMDLASHSSDAAERQALADALANLRVLRREAGVRINDASQDRPPMNGSKQNHL